MRQYVIRRLLWMIVTLVGITIITFIISQVAPGSPATAALGLEPGTIQEGTATKQAIELWNKKRGLDKPIYTRYALWLGAVTTLDFGASYKDQRPVRTVILETLPITLQINIISILLAYVLAIPLGVHSAVRAGAVSERITTVILFILYSLPSFWVAYMLIYFLAGGNYLNIFPVGGINSAGAETFGAARWLVDRLWHLVLPVVCLTYGALAGISRYMRSGMMEVLRQDYIRTARAKGLSERAVVFKHALRNSVIPIITILAGLLPSLIGGAVITETIFNIPGMGRLAFNAVLTRDYPVIMAVATISAVLTLIGILMSDITYAVVDPRIKYE
jgi:peptide/nickel transport system permease protein